MAKRIRCVDSKPIQQIEFVVQLKNLDDNDNAVDADGRQPLFLLPNSQKIKETRLKFSQGAVIVLSKMANYKGVKVKSRNNQLKKHQPAAEEKAGTTLGITKKKF